MNEAVGELVEGQALHPLHCSLLPLILQTLIANVPFAFLHVGVSFEVVMQAIATALQ